MLKKYGAKAGDVRDLAYVLYSICEKAGRREGGDRLQRADRGLDRPDPRGGYCAAVEQERPDEI